MAIAWGGVAGTATDTASGTTISVTTTVTIPAGSIVFLGVACDNSGSNLPNFTTSGLGEGLVTPLAFGGDATAGNTNRFYEAFYRVVASIPSGTVITVTLSAAVSAKVMAITYWTADTVPIYTGNYTGSTSNAATSTSVSHSAALSGDFAIATAGVEHATATPDAGWNTRLNLSVGSGDTGMSLLVSDKVPTGGANVFAVTTGTSCARAITAFGFTNGKSVEQSIVSAPGRLLLVGSGSGGSAVPTVGQLWPRGNW